MTCYIVMRSEFRPFEGTFQTVFWCGANKRAATKVYKALTHTRQYSYELQTWRNGVQVYD
jgi:hypothetical protein